MSAFEKSDLTPLTAVHKLYWASFHRGLGELAVDVLGMDATIVGEETSEQARRAAHVPLHARRHDLRRLEPDPTQRHR